MRALGYTNAQQITDLAPGVHTIQPNGEANYGLSIRGAAQSDFVADLVDDLYIKARQALNELIPQINPTLTQKESEQIALYMCAAMEGLTIFAGHEKPWSAQLGTLKQMSINNFMDIIKNTKGSKRVQSKPKS